MPGPLLCKWARYLKAISDMNGLLYMHSKESEARESGSEQGKFGS